MLTPEAYAKDDSEHSQQVALMMWIAADMLPTYPQLKWLYAIPNGGERNKAVAGNMKAEGVKKGVSDLCLPLARRGYHGLYIEMKKPSGGVISEEQKEFLDFVCAEGYCGFVCWSWLEAKAAIMWYMGE